MTDEAFDEAVSHIVPDGVSSDSLARAMAPAPVVEGAIATAAIDAGSAQLVLSGKCSSAAPKNKSAVTYTLVSDGEEDKGKTAPGYHSHRYCCIYLACFFFYVQDDMNMITHLRWKFI